MYKLLIQCILKIYVNIFVKNALHIFVIWQTLYHFVICSLPIFIKRTILAI